MKPTPAERRAARIAHAAAVGERARWLPWAVGAALLVTLVLAAAMWWARSSAPAASPPRAALPAELPPPVVPTAPAAATPAGSGDSTRDPVGQALDLLQVVDIGLRSVDPAALRAMAVAWQTCVPLLPGPAGTASGAERVLAAMNARQREQREPAVRELERRCERLRALAPDARAALATQIERALGEQARQSPGELALAAQLRGDAEEARTRLLQVLMQREPLATLSLAGLVGPMQLPLAGDAPALMDVALVQLACEQGLHCDAGALPALRLCVSDGLCTGTLAQRWLQRSFGLADGLHGELQPRYDAVLAALRAAAAGEAAMLIPAPTR